MKLNLFLLLMIASLFISCETKATEQTKEEPKETPKAEVNKDTIANARIAPECYGYLGKKDTIYLKLGGSSNMMSGFLHYKYYQQNRILATFKGKMAGDVLIADYIYKKDGKVISRQVAFKKIGDDFVEGNGDMKDVNGKMVFKDVNALTFSDVVVLRKISCRQ